MRKTCLFFSFIAFGLLLSACSEQSEEDKVEEVTLTIYEETGMGRATEDYWFEFFMLSDSNDKKKRSAMLTLIEGISFNYERGYRYTFKAQKIWMVNPPQDISNIKYNIQELLSKEKVITTDKEEELNLTVAAETVKFSPFHREGMEEKLYDALSVVDVAQDKWMAIIEIEGFEYEAGYEYEIKVKKTTRANPYAISYTLLNVLSKQKK